MLRIATFNIQHGIGTDGRLSLHRVANTVAATMARVVCLQEVDLAAWRSWFVRQHRSLARATGTTSAFAPADRVGVIGYHGNALLVDGEIMRTTTFRLPYSRPTRSCLLAQVRVDGEVFTVGSVHLAVSWAEASAQLDALRARLRTIGGPVVLGGDFNLSGQASRDTLLAEGFAVSPGLPTFPAPVPRAGIDWLAVRGGALSEVETVATDASDHLPLVACVELDADHSESDGRGSDGAP